MIFSSLNSKEYVVYPEAVKKAIEYLKSNDFSKFEEGVYEIEGDKIFAQVFDATPKKLEEIKSETHRKYIDIQYIVYGKEQMGVCNLDDTFEIDQEIIERDLIFYKYTKNEGLITASEGDYCIFFPNDVHRPSIIIDNVTKVRKVVIKVSMDLI